MYTIGPIEKLGTIWWFEFFDLDEQYFPFVKDALVDEIDRFEQAYSRFLPHSDISQLNKEKIFHNPSAEFLGLIRIAQSAYTATGGVFNVAVKNYLDSIGYDVTYSLKPREHISVVPDLSHVLFTNATSIILKDDASIDFGGFGKGYLIDILAKFIQERYHCSQFLINGGGDMFATHQNSDPVIIGLQHPHQSSIVGTLEIKNCGFAASSPYVRRWKNEQGKTFHHLAGSDEAQAVYVVAPTACLADIWATTLSVKHDIVAPPEVKWIRWDDNRQELVQGY